MHETKVLKYIPPDLKDAQAIQSLPEPEEYTKIVGIECNSGMDHFHLTIAKLPPLDNITKRMLVFNVAKTFDILGWFSPTTIKVTTVVIGTILYQLLFTMTGYPSSIFSLTSTFPDVILTRSILFSCMDFATCLRMLMQP